MGYAARQAHARLTELGTLHQQQRAISAELGGLGTQYNEVLDHATTAAALALRLAAAGAELAEVALSALEGGTDLSPQERLDLRTNLTQLHASARNLKPEVEQLRARKVSL